MNTGLYRYNDSVNNMETALEKTLLEWLDEKLQASDFPGSIIDETVNKKLIMYAKTKREGKTETCLGELQCTL